MAPHASVRRMIDNASKSNDFVSRLQRLTEALLTRRRRKQLREKMKQQRRNPILDWVLAILWAACVVLVINQYIFQNYQIPSESMVKTLNIGDMIFVDKFSFGPEILPGVAKTGGIAQPRRGQVIVFENPSYLSKGPVFTIVQQMIYMLTLTFIDIDRDENGEQRVHYLIKRAVGFAGDWLRIVDGEVFIRPEGSAQWYREKDLMDDLGLPFRAERSFPAREYEAIHGVGKASAYQEKGLPIPLSVDQASVASAYKDAFGYDQVRVTTLKDMDPSDARIAATARRYALGWYVAPGRIFPMGDNRDNSRDARYFGPVSVKRVLGRALLIYWPLPRAGAIR